MPVQPLQPLLKRIGSLPTSGARAAEIFRIDGAIHLAVPQLAYDVADTPAHMNGGDSDTDMLMFRWDGTGFVEEARLAVPGGEDAEFFTIDGSHYLATASARSGKGPYQAERRVDDLSPDRTSGGSRSGACRDSSPSSGVNSASAAVISWPWRWA